jgi:hypothetical protein
MLAIIVNIALLLAIAIAYAAFDVFNKRNVPNIFVYAALALGVAVTLLNGVYTAEISLAIALVVGAAGYAIYRIGYWGAGDFFELVTISLILPIQQTPLLLSVNQYGMPFLLSVFIAAGVSAVWIVPLYYLSAGRNAVKVKSKGLATEKKILSIVMLAMYLLLFFVISSFFRLSATGAVILAAFAIPSVVMPMYESRITQSMAKPVSAKELEEGDMLALNLMDEKDISYFKRRSKHFGRLVTNEFLNDLRNSDRKLQVYRNAAPFALFILIGTVISLLLGNLMLLIV